MTDDRDLQERVQKALDWEPSIDAADIGVSVDNGVVTLRGEVRTYSQRSAAERVTHGVYGVRAVANDLNVRLLAGDQRTDSEIAQAVLSALKWNTRVLEERLKVTVSNGIVNLSGEVDWEYQRTAAYNAVRDLTGVRGVTNLMHVKPHVSTADVRAKIEEALKRSAQIDARRISVQVADGKVTLAGHVHSWYEAREAKAAAWAAPGVREVDDRIAVMP